MIVVADAGPLIALAKLDALGVLRGLHPRVIISPAVHEESVTQGLALGAEDAPRLQAEYERGALAVRAPTAAPLPVPALLGPGEEESIRLVIELPADLLLLDDLDARRAAVRNLEAAGVASAIQGTLGLLVSAYRQAHLGRDRAIELVEALRGRPDIWISAHLCDQVIDLLRSSG